MFTVEITVIKRVNYQKFHHLEITFCLWLLRWDNAACAVFIHSSLISSYLIIYIYQTIYNGVTFSTLKKFF